MLSRTRVSHTVYTALLSALALLLLAFAPFARAAITHPYTGVSFGPGGVGSGSFGFVQGVAVDQRNGDVLVYDDAEGGRVYKFDAAGEPVDFSSTGTNVIEGVGGSGVGNEIAVDSSSSADAGDIYVATGQVVRIYSESGASLGELHPPNSALCGVAVDPSGNVYAATFENEGQVTRFAPSTSPVTNADEDGVMGGLKGFCNIAVDGAGDVYVASWQDGVNKYEAMQFGSLSASGTLVDSTLDANALALDAGEEELFVDEYAAGETARVLQFDTNTEPPHFQGTSGSSGTGTLTSSYGLGVDHASGEVYAGDDTTVEIFGPGITVAGASIEATSEVKNTTATLHGSVEPEGGELTSCVFEYGAEAGSLTSSVPCEPAAPYTGTTSITVSARLSGLQPNTTYYFRIAASEAGGGTLASLEATLLTTAPPTITEEGASPVGTSSVTLNAMTDDYGASATYRSEYGTTIAYGSSTPPMALASSEQYQHATATLGALQPGTTYHFRLVVEGEGGTTHGPDYIFTTKPLAPPPLTLPDGRIYEKVSPSDNADGNTYQDDPVQLGSWGVWTLQPFAVSPDGSAVAYMGEPSETGGTGQEGGSNGNQYVARRLSGGGWSASNVEPVSGSKEEQPVYLGFSSDLSVGFLDANSVTPLAEGAPGEGFHTLYAKTFSSGSYQALLRTRPPRRTATNFRITYAGGTADLSHELFTANDKLTENAAAGGSEEPNLYDASGGTTTLVNVLPNGRTEPGATFGGQRLLWTEEENTPMLGHDISEDGSRIFWTDLNSEDLYVRENDTAPQSPIAEGKCTVPTDACTVLIAEEGQFWDASPDGSKVLYTKGGDLYEYDVSTGQSVDLAPGGSVNGVVAASEDLSYVYFVAKAALAPGAEPVSCQEGWFPPRTSHCNLYVIHVGESPKFIGALSAQDNAGQPQTYNRVDGDWQGSLGDEEAEVTPDGMHLLFVSKANLSGYESNYSEQVFMYDFPTGQLDCLSCKPDGEAMEVTEGGRSAYLPVSNIPTRLPQWMSDDGDRVFFDTLTPLVSQDTNNKTDVYEWERDGSGSCTKSPGCIYLISDGTSSEGSYLIGTSQSGDDVFFTTRDKLVPEDENENIDVYDARAGAVQPPVAPKCTGTGCQGVASAPPIFATPPSVTYNGVGNLEASPPAAKAKSKPLTRAQKLARALRACGKKAERKRAACERQARSSYGAKQKPSPKKRGNTKKTSRRGK